MAVAVATSDTGDAPDTSANDGEEVTAVWISADILPDMVGEYSAHTAIVSVNISSSTV